MSIPALRAEDQLSAAVAGRIAGLTAAGWTEATSGLQQVARPFEPIQSTIIHAKHADWFEREGIPYKVAEVLH